MAELFGGRVRQTIDDLDEELVEFLSRNGANLEMVETSGE